MLYPTSCLFCLQGEGVGRVGALATVMAAVDLARVRQPVHVEQSGAEEEPVALQLQAAAPHVSLDLNVPLSQVRRGLGKQK